MTDEKLTTEEREALYPVLDHFGVFGGTANRAAAFVRAAVAAVPRLASAPAGEREVALCAECGHREDSHTGPFTACNDCHCNGWNPASPSPGAAREEAIGSGD